MDFTKEKTITKHQLMWFMAGQKGKSMKKGKWCFMFFWKFLSPNFRLTLFMSWKEKKKLRSIIVIIKESRDEDETVLEGMTMMTTKHDSMRFDSIWTVYSLGKGKADQRDKRETDLICASFASSSSSYYYLPVTHYYPRVVKTRHLWQTTGSL